MSQRSFFFVAVLLLGLFGGLAATLLVLVRQEPAWYTAAGMAPGGERHLASEAFKTELSAMLSSTEPEPHLTFTDTQTNSFFEEEFLAMHYDRQFSMDNLAQPRIAFAPEHVKLGFRYGHGLWNSIVSINLRVWIPANQPNVIAMELEGFHAGALPISAQSLLEEIAEIGRKNGIDVNWYRLHNHPVALLRFQPDQPRPTFQLKAVQLNEHSITIQWHPLDAVPVRLPDPKPTPAATTP
jgi:hypothetical protein